MQKIYFIGIGGIGMSALARYYRHAGAEVAGYDRTSSPLTMQLEREGIAIHYEDNLDLIPESFKAAVGEVLVIYTPAVPPTHGELLFFRQNGYKILKRSAALGHLAADKNTMAIAGTHGKTTVTTQLAHLLTQTGDGCTAFLGGISKNYNTNLILSESQVLVAEADEFDRSFLQLFPQIAVITAVDPDHLDIYGTVKEMKQAFVDFACQIKPGGALVIKHGIDLPLPDGQIAVYRYSLDQPCDFYASRIRRMDNGALCFDLHLCGTLLRDCTLGVPGRMNVENAVAAAAVAFLYHRQQPDAGYLALLKQALADFTGVQRRFDVRLNTPTCTYVDDYAHHPEELRSAITSLRDTCPGRKLTGIFQPHLYSRTRDFADGFARSLDLLDRLILLDIYPAREAPIPGVSAQLIFDKMTLPDKLRCTKDNLLSLLETEPVDLLATFGAGDIDCFVEPITALLNRRIKS